MKTCSFKALAITSIIVLISLSTTYSQNKNQNYQKSFHEIDSLVSHADQPNKAIRMADSLLRLAKSDKNDLMKAKALIYKYNLLAITFEDSIISTIIGFENELKNCEGIIRPILESNLAELYYRYSFFYFWKVENKIEFKNDSSDFRFWDKQHIDIYIFHLYNKSLSYEFTKQTPASAISEIVGTDNYNTERPTYFDFLAHRALEYYLKYSEYQFPQIEGLFYTNPELFYKKLAGLKQEYPIACGSYSVLKELMHLHQTGNPAAYVHCKIRLLKEIHDRYTLENKGKLYINQLKSLATRNKQSIAYADIAYEIANYYTNYRFSGNSRNGEDSCELAITYLKSALTVNKGKHSQGITACQDLLSAINHQFIEISAPNYNYYEKGVDMKINYGNINEIKIKVIRSHKTINDSLNRISSLFRWKNETKLKMNYLNSLPVDTLIVIKVGASKDYKSKTINTNIKGLSFGNYILIPVIDTINKSWSNNYINICITNLAYFFIDSPNGKKKGFVTDLINGKPIKGIIVNIRDNGKEDKPIIAKYLTDEKGFFAYKQSNRDNNLLEFISESDSLSAYSYYNSNFSQSYAVNTDRYIYRPGQDIFFKAMVLNYNENNLLLSNKSDHLEVYLSSNSYGRINSSTQLYPGPYYTFSGSIKAPTDKLGEMSLLGRKIRVEEYKRPSFEIQLFSSKTSYKPGDEIELTGKVMNYAGNKVDRANITYKLSFSWTTDSAGKTKVDDKGEFHIKIKLSRNNQSCLLVANVTATDDLGESQSKEFQFRYNFPDIIISTNFLNQFDINQLNKFNIKANYCNGTKCDTNLSIKIISVKPNIESSDGLKGNLYKDKQVIISSIFNTKNESAFSLDKSKFPPGKYKITINLPGSKDNIYEREFFVCDLKNSGFVSDTELLLFSKNDTLNVGDTAKIYLYSPLANAHALLIVEDQGEIVEEKWMDISNGNSLSFIIGEFYKHQFAIRAIMINNGKFYNEDRLINIVKKNRLNISILKIKKIVKPEDEDEIILKITDDEGKPVKAEGLASMYDVSLDIFGKLNWYKDFQFDYRPNRLDRFPNYESNLSSFSVNKKGKYPKYQFVPFFEYNVYPYDTLEYNLLPIEEVYESFCLMSSDKTLNELGSLAPENKGMPKFRKDFRETAFFLPNLETDEDGIVKFKYKMPEALTRWRLMIFAQTKDLEFGYHETEITSQKELMIIPNAPRFVTEGDEIYFAAKLVNYTDSAINGKIKLQLINTETLVPINSTLLDNDNILKFEIPAKQSESFKWKINIPVGQCHSITYKFSAITDNFSDGQEASIPVLSRQILITESQPFRVNKQSEKLIKFERFAQSDFTKQIPFKLSFELNQNPIWDVLKALPYLIEYPYECNEQLLNRLYALVVAKCILEKYPEISSLMRRYNSKNLNISNLNKDQNLKNTLIQETPWVFEANNEEQNFKRIAGLFEIDSMNKEIYRIKDKIEQRQNNDGTFSWFPGGSINRYISQYMIEKIGDIEEIENHQNNYNLGTIAANAINHYDYELKNKYDQLLKLKQNLDEYQPDYSEIHYLYVRSSWLKSREISSFHQKSFDYFLKQSFKFWKNYNNYGRGMLAIALKRFNKAEQANIIMASLKDNAITTENNEMFWNKSNGWEWYHHDIETHTLLMKAFAEVLNDTISVEKMKTWLLRNKKMNHWNSTKSTSSAIYSLLNLGNDWLKDRKPVDAKVGETILNDKKNDKVNDFENITTSWTGTEISKDKADIQIKNPNDFPVWGGMYWQYFQNQDSVSASSIKEMQINRVLFSEKDINGKKVFEKITSNTILQPGDLVIIKMGINIGEDMEFVHVKDCHGACLEPVNNLSGYKNVDGTYYYETPKDASVHFFFDQINKGEYVIEYKCRVSQLGDFSNGICTIENMYAPEFKAQTSSMRIKSGN
jgi:uncharacterized protein YfaS (alpha-2-macroglobulin family)